MSDAKTFIIKNYFDRTLPIDDGIAGELTAAALPVRIRRFTVLQLQEFMRGFERVERGLAERFIYRKADGDEQTLRPDGRTFVLPMSEIERRRLSEMNEATRAEFDGARLADEEHLRSFCTAQISDHVWLPPGVVLRVEREDGDALEVRNGKGLVEAFGGNLSMLTLMARAIFEENTLPPEKKRQLRLRSASSASSPTPDAAAVDAGARQDESAGSVASEASAPSADASADLVPTLSGSTAT